MIRCVVVDSTLQVYTGVAAFFMSPDIKLAPFYMGHNKLLLTTPSHHALYFDAVKRFNPRLKTGLGKMFGWPHRMEPVPAQCVQYC